MKRWLLWSLAGAVVLSAWALFDQKRADSAPASSRVVQPTTLDGVAQGSAGAGSAAKSPPPGQWPEPAMDEAARSPFAMPTPPAARPSMPVAPVVVAPPPPPPTAGYRFWGRLSSPDGNSLVFLAKLPAGSPVEIHTGTRLEDGWAVDGISDNAIVLARAATQQRTTILVPAADTTAGH